MTQRAPLHPSPQALRRGRGPERDAGRSRATGPHARPGPLGLSSAALLRLPEPQHSLQHLAMPLLPRFLSVSPPQSPCATVPSDSSVHTRTQRASSCHFPELNSRRVREGTRASITGPRLWPESGGLRAAGVRLPSARVRALALRPTSAPIAFFLRPTTPQRSPSHRPRAGRSGLACSRLRPSQASSRPVGKGSEQGAYVVQEAAATTETAALALSALWRLPGADKRRERERARGCGDDDGSFLLVLAALAVGASMMN